MYHSRASRSSSHASSHPEGGGGGGMDYLTMLAGMGVGIQDVEMEVPGDRGCVPLDVLLERTPGTRRGSALSSSAGTVGYAVSSRSGSSASGPVNPPAVSTGSVTNKLRKGSRKKCKPLECSQEGPTPSCSSAASLGASATPSTPGGAVTRKKASRRKSEKKSAKETRKRRSGWLLVNHNSNKSWRKILWKDMHVRAQSTGIWLCEDKDTEVPVAVIPLSEVQVVAKTSKDVGGRDFCFAIMTPEQHYCFQARSDEHCGQWCLFFEKLLMFEKERHSKKDRQRTLVDCMRGGAGSADEADQDSDTADHGCLPGGATSPPASPACTAEERPAKLRPLPAAVASPADTSPATRRGSAPLRAHSKSRGNPLAA